MKFAGCFCCGSHDFKIIVDSRNIKHFMSKVNLVQCSNCKFYFIYPRPTKSEISRLYKNYEIKSQWELGSEIFNKKNVKIIKEEVKKKGNILEIGCSYGKILNLLQKEKYDVFGIESSEIACRYIKRNFSFHVFKGLVEDFEDSDYKNKFDAVLMFNVIEHLIEPLKILVKLKRYLSKNGKLFIIVPNISFALLWFKLRNILKSEDPYGLFQISDRGPIAFNSPGHLSFFNMRTLRMILERANFRIIKICHAPYVLSGFPSRTMKDMLKPFISSLSNILLMLYKRDMPLGFSTLVIIEKV